MNKITQSAGHFPPANQAGRRVRPALKPSASLVLKRRAKWTMGGGEGQWLERGKCNGDRKVPVRKEGLTINVPVVYMVRDVMS